MPKETLTPLALRVRAGLTQREAAIALGKRESTVSDWERGVARPRLYLSEVKILMRVYKASLDELIEAFDP